MPVKRIAVRIAGEICDVAQPDDGTVLMKDAILQIKWFAGLVGAFVFPDKAIMVVWMDHGRPKPARDPLCGCVAGDLLNLRADVDAGLDVVHRRINVDCNRSLFHQCSILGFGVPQCFFYPFMGGHVLRKPRIIQRFA